MAPRYTIATKRAPNPTDKHIGSRVRMRRKMLAMSQTKLGAALGVTFQQVQKYEKGTNRIGAGRLQQISHILQVPVVFFFEGALNASPQVPMAQIDAFVSDSNGLRLIGAFMRIDNIALRRRIVMLVQKIADDAHLRNRRVCHQRRVLVEAERTTPQRRVSAVRHRQPRRR
jgi:transcriptional regulator with XRE-family HTH domain